MASEQKIPIAPRAAQPLISLDAVAFDTETTGLDTANARIVQIGAIRLHKGKLEHKHAFQQLVNPGEPIPRSSSDIHGIFDSDVATADDFISVNQAFENWRDRAVLIGYASGFDLAMFKRESRLAGIEWVSPRALDIRYLVNIVAPNLPEFSLDTIASWLGLEIKNRHSALGDAIATAEIFLALIPLLREKQIRTLAEAERACQQYGRSISDEVSLGWHDLEAHEDNFSLVKGLTTNIDSYPYQHRLCDIMTSPALFVEANQTLADTLKLMIDHQTSSVFVHLPKNSVGIVTERDLLRTLNSIGKDGFVTTVSNIAQYPLLSLPQDAFAYRAISRMKRWQVRHLGVHDDSGKTVGALSARDLLRHRADRALILGDEIDHAENAEAMATVWANIALVATALASEDMDAREISSVISRELCALTRQACKLAEANMLAEGLGKPPCNYAALVLGSGGRGESLLAMDQDNAIIFAEPAEDHDSWFAELGKRMSDILHIAGVPYCKGNIMASNSEWCHSESAWKDTVSHWISRQTPEDILNCDIFFDSVCVHGDKALANRVLDHAFQLGSQSSTFIKLMSVNACKIRTPIGLFGRFQLEDGRMDLKMGGIMSLFSCARILAIQNRCRELSTPARFQAIYDKKQHMQSTFENLIEAHRIIFNRILDQQIEDLKQGIPLSNRVTPANMSASKRKQLKWALEQVPNVSNLLDDPLASI